jgi:hypothetical protein
MKNGVFFQMLNQSNNYCDKGEGWVRLFSLTSPSPSILKNYKTLEKSKEL